MIFDYLSDKVDYNKVDFEDPFNVMTRTIVRARFARRR